MREFKVTQMNFAKNKLVENYVMFSDYQTADDWAIAKNDEREGSVLDIEDVTSHNDSKYEF